MNQVDISETTFTSILGRNPTPYKIDKFELVTRSYYECNGSFFRKIDVFYDEQITTYTISDEDMV